MTIVAVVILGIVVLVFVMASNANARRAEAIHNLGREIDRETKLVNAIERATRIRVLGAMLHGQKCKGCNTIVPRDELEEAGETTSGKPILLCKKCRTLMGLE